MTLAPTCSQPPARARALLAVPRWCSGLSTRGQGVRHRWFVTGSSAGILQPRRT